MKIGIIGLGTLGEYYTRDFNRFNTKVIVSKNSTLKSTINKNNLLKKKYKLNILAAKNYSEILIKLSQYFQLANQAFFHPHFVVILWVIKDS